MATFCLTVNTSQVKEVNVNEPKIVKDVPGCWRKLDTLWVGECVIEPATASSLLATTNHHNRRMSRTHSKFLAGLIKRGCYLFNGDTIVFAGNGQLVNGQHRLDGCARSGRSVRTLVVYGVDPEVFKTHDQMRSRTLTQIMEISGEENSVVLAPATQAVMSFFFTGQPIVRGLQVAGFSRGDQAAAADLFPDLRESATFAAANYGKCGLFNGAGAVATLHWVLSRHHSKLASEMLDALLDEDKPMPGGAVRTLQNQLQQGKKKARLNPAHIAAITIKTFNSLVEGQPLKQLKWDDREDFPQVAGWKYVDRSGDGVGLPVLGDLSAEKIRQLLLEVQS